MSYVLFLDESGDHNLSSIDKNFPAFCVAGCAFERKYYKEVARPAVERLKEDFWGNSDIIFHSSEIRKRSGDFSFLYNHSKRQEFYEAINQLITDLDFKIIAVVIQKEALLKHYGDSARHPYHLSLEFLLERYARFIKRRDKNADGYILAEARGRKEDSLLKKQFSYYKEYGTRYENNTALANVTTLWMEKKKANIAGLQIADLVAYPIARKVLHPEKEIPSFDILQPKLDTAPNSNNALGFGLKIFPQTTLEHHRIFNP